MLELEIYKSFAVNDIVKIVTMGQDYISAI